MTYSGKTIISDNGSIARSDLLRFTTIESSISILLDSNLITYWIVYGSRGLTLGSQSRRWISYGIYRVENDLLVISVLESFPVTTFKRLRVQCLYILWGRLWYKWANKRGTNYRLLTQFYGCHECQGGLTLTREITTISYLTVDHDTGILLTNPHLLSRFSLQ